MNIAQRIKNVVMGSKTPDELFKTYWEEHGFKGTNRGDSTVTTAPVQRILHNENKDKLQEYKGMTRNAIAKQKNMQHKAMDGGEVEGSTPLIFDPEILSIVFENAPLLDQIAMEGQQGFDAVYNRIDSRDDPIGFAAEADVLDLSGTAGKDIGLTKGSVDMTIYVDLAEISDFTQAAADHYMNVSDTTLGSRVALYAQKKEQQILYGDKDKGLDNGFIFDSNGYDGLATIYTDASNNTDKSGTSSDFVKSIKSEIMSMLQNENVSISDLRIATSWDMFDSMTSELVPSQIRYGPQQTATDVGIQQLRIQGVPVTPTHNVKLHQETETVSAASTGSNTVTVPNDYTSVLAADDTFVVGGDLTLTVASTSYSSANDETTITVDALSEDVTGEEAVFDLAGDNGDVFIWNTRAVRFRSLVPFSTVPLAKLGLAETTALFEFGALIDKSGGNWGRYLSAYNI